jgi:hypothetical protein
MQNFYEDQVKLYSEAADVTIYYTVHLYVELKSWKPLPGVRLEAQEAFVDWVEFDYYEATEYYPEGHRVAEGNDEESFKKIYPQLAAPWETFKAQVLKGDHHV